MSRPPISVHLGHGASGNAASMQPFVDGLRVRGIDATAVDLPKRKAEDAVPVWLAKVPGGPGVVVGGHSYGGRVASLAAAAEPGRYQALILFSYPLHPPGAPDRTATRIAHWASLTLPVLLLSGESDPFARIDLLRESVRLLPGAELVTYPRVGHGVRPVLDDALDRVCAFLSARVT